MSVVVVDEGDGAVVVWLFEDLGEPVECVPLACTSSVHMSRTPHSMLGAMVRGRELLDVMSAFQIVIRQRRSRQQSRVCCCASQKGGKWRGGALATSRTPKTQRSHSHSCNTSHREQLTARTVVSMYMYVQLRLDDSRQHKTKACLCSDELQHTRRALK